MAWLICGPIGHALAGFLDWFVLLVRFGWAKAHGRQLQ